MVPIWSGEVDLTSDYTLFHNEPRQFEIKFSHPQPELDLNLEFSVTYDISSIGRQDLPLTIFIERKDSVEGNFPPEYPYTFSLKEDGKWKGTANANQVDYVISDVVIERISLKSDATYTLKVYANDSRAGKIYGIVKIAARLYEFAPPDEE